MRKRYRLQFPLCLACPEGFEPPAYGLEVRCSIQLSYGQIGLVRKSDQEGNPDRCCKVGRDAQPAEHFMQVDCKNETQVLQFLAHG